MITVHPDCQQTHTDGTDIHFQVIIITIIKVGLQKKWAQEHICPGTNGIWKAHLNLSWQISFHIQIIYFKILSMLIQQVLKATWTGFNIICVAYITLYYIKIGSSLRGVFILGDFETRVVFKCDIYMYRN